MMHLKKLLILALSFCLIFSSTTAYCSNIKNKNILSDSYDSLLNIQKQINLISRNGYINNVNGQPNGTLLSQLNIFSSQLNGIKNDLQTAKSKNPTDPNLESLITISNYLSYIYGKTYEFLSSSDPAIQYRALEATFLANSLVNQVFLYANIK